MIPLMSNDPRDELAEANDAAVADFLRRCEYDRTVLYQTHLRCSVRFASPILLSLAAAEGISPAEIVREMLPPPEWPRRSPMDWGSSKRRMIASTVKGYPGGEFLDRTFARRLAYGGYVVRLPAHPAGRFGVWAAGDTLDACVDLGPTRLLVAGSEARLRLPSGVPETLALAMVGRSVDRLVSHPLFDGRGYVVRRLLQVPSEMTQILVFGCGLEAIDLLDAQGCAS